MYARGILAKGQPTEVIWSRKWGINLFRNTIPRDRYKELLIYVRFDIRSTRSQRLQNDRFALISMVWGRFVENFKSSYRPSENITIDEQLFPTKARYPFTQYMAKRPDKFGIKFWLAVDSSSKYLVNGFPYLGKDSQRPANKSLSEYVVMKLKEPYLGKWRNVTTDNFFTSLSLANELQKNRRLF
ncbi:piggyBac transposable element-derived protein 4-like [Lepeophtheirus salmonis]|uniref:piggyBac transposable element-derived protein 4-like n=1 Tax=Lepeophtheirus salmonis TaxID=72036 RepID=UPI003AF385D7